MTARAARRDPLGGAPPSAAGGTHEPLNLLLVPCCWPAAWYLVKTAYESRRLFAELDRARNEQGQLDTEFKRLEAERKAQATNLRVEQVAREKLRMRTATPAVTQYVVDEWPRRPRRRRPRRLQ